MAGGGPWGGKLEGAYISVVALRRYDPGYRQPFISGRDTPFGITVLGADWVLNRHILCQRGITVYGPPPATLIEPVSPEELIEAVRQELAASWQPYLQEPGRLRSRRYQSYAVLTLCRALCALEQGELASKPVAAAWARVTLGPRWAPLIDRALAWRHDEAIDEAALPQTLAFLRYVVERGLGRDARAPLGPARLRRGRGGRPNISRPASPSSRTAAVPFPFSTAILMST